MRDGTTNGHSQAALSLIEIMVAVALLAVIILGLVAMFDQTRKAFTLGLTTADYQDSGRVVMDMLGRELQQMTPMTATTYFTNTANPAAAWSNSVNFYVDADPGYTNLTWPLLGSDTMVTAMDRLLFVTRYNQQWSAIGYKVDPNGVGLGVGTLYRYSATSIPVSNLPIPPALLNDFSFNNVFSNPAYTTSAAPFNRIIDGVVDFRVRAYTGTGTNNFIPGPGVLITNVFTNASFLTTNIYAAPYFAPSQAAGEYQYEFFGNAVPGYVEVELGVLEPRTLERFRALTNSPAAAAAFLLNHAGQVHVFRQRFPIRSVDPSMYP